MFHRAIPLSIIPWPPFGNVGSIAPHGWDGNTTDKNRIENWVSIRGLALPSVLVHSASCAGANMAAQRPAICPWRA